MITSNSSFTFFRLPFLVIFLLLLCANNNNFVVNGMTGTPEKEHEKFLSETYNLIGKDRDDEFKSRFADDAEIRLCFGSMPNNECWEGGVEVFDPLLNIGLKKFQWSGRWMSAVDDHGGFFQSFIVLETLEGCRVRAHSSLYHEINSDGKITKHYGYSDDKGYFIKCLFPELNIEIPV